MSKLAPLDDFKTEDLPEKTKPNWKLWGPGAILVGLSIGAGEIIIWPRIVAEYGGTMVWAAVFGVFLQLWINFEVGRWTVATGETVYTGFARVWRGFAPLFIILILLGWLAPGWAQASGLALKALLFGPDAFLERVVLKNGQMVSRPTSFLGTRTFWTAMTFVVVAVVLFGPKLIYKSVERTVEGLVVLITVGLIVLAVIAGTASTWRELGTGIVSVGQISTEGHRRLKVEGDVVAQLDQGKLPKQVIDAVIAARGMKANSIEANTSVKIIKPGAEWKIGRDGKQSAPVVKSRNDFLVVTTPGISLKDFFIALVFAGAGGTANLFYTFYLRDKAIGMGALVPQLTNVLRGRSEKVPTTGFKYEDNEKNQGRFASWWAYVRQDQLIFFFLLNAVTILLFIFGSLAVLHPQGIVPEKNNLIWGQAQAMEPWWPSVGPTIFLIVGVATLFSTQLTLLDGCSRSISDIIYTNIKPAQKKDLNWWYMVIVIAWMVCAIVMTYVMERMGVSNLGFLFSAAYMGGFAMAVYVPLQLYCNLKYLPKSARPGPICVSMMIVASIVYVGFAVASIYWEVVSRLDPSLTVQ